MTDDVRMRGFRRRTAVDAVWDHIDALSTQPLPEERIPTAEAAGRVTAHDVVAPMAVPRFERSAMDGYAVVAADTIGATPNNPVTLKVTGESFPGRTGRTEPPSVVAGVAVRIMTGAPLPSGATAVVPVESTRESQLESGAIDVVEPVAERRHIGRVGEDIAQGTVVCSAGQLLLPQHLGVLASLGVADIAVIRRPQVRIVATGQELVPVGEPLGERQIHDANSPMLSALVARDGGRVTESLRVADDRAALEAALCRPGCDVLLVSGGSSVGAEDFAPAIIADHGELTIHGIAMRPSSPAGCGRLGTALVFLLPGNPVSCLCAYDFFAGRAIRRLGGRSRHWPYRPLPAVLQRRIVSAVGRTDYCRVRIGEAGVEPLAISGASVLSSTTRADGFVVVPAALEGYAAGEHVTVWRYDNADPGQVDPAV